MKREPLTIKGAADRLAAGDLSSEQLVGDLLAATRALDPEVGAYIDVYEEQALAAATAADRERESGATVGPLHGVPIAIKDIVACREGQTTGQSNVFDPEWWAGKDAPVVTRLRDAGAIITGKTTTMEHACGLPDPGGRYPLPRNPWWLEGWSGGSSSGSGAAVAAGFALGAIGTDTGGSIRVPAAFCGITGLKQTYGLVTRAGCTPLAPTLDHIGPMARSAYDCALMLDAITAPVAGEEPHREDREPAAEPRRYAERLDARVEGLRIGVDHAAYLDAEESVARDLLGAAAARLEGLGATVRPIEIPYYKELDTAALVCLLSEAWTYHRPFLAERWEEYGPFTRLNLGNALLMSANDYVQAQKARAFGAQVVGRELFEDVDVILTPTILRGAIPIEGLTWDAHMSSINTAIWNSFGNPAASVPMGFDEERRPLGMQVIGRAFEDEVVLNVAHAYQLATDHHLQASPAQQSVLAGAEW